MPMTNQPHRDQTTNDPYRDLDVTTEHPEPYPSQAEIVAMLKFMEILGASPHTLQKALQDNFEYEPSQATARVRKFICTGV